MGGFLNTLLRQSDRVRVALPGADRQRHRPAGDQRNGVLRQSIYYPYAWALQYARGRVLDLSVESETYPIQPPVCGRTSRVTIRCRSWTSSPRSMRRAARRAC